MEWPLWEWIRNLCNSRSSFFYLSPFPSVQTQLKHNFCQTNVCRENNRVLLEARNENASLIMFIFGSIWDLEHTHLRRAKKTREAQPRKKQSGISLSNWVFSGEKKKDWNKCHRAKARGLFTRPFSTTDR